MKKFMSLVILLCCILLFESCSSQSSSTKSYEDENGNYVIESEGDRTVLTSRLPIDVPYNDATITLKNVEFYQNAPNYSHNLFIVTTLDVGSLSEEQLHWLRESDLDVYSYITSEKNDYDFERSSSLGDVLFDDTKELVFVSTSSFWDENRYSFADSEVSVCITIDQEETYEYENDSGETKQLKKSEEVTYKTTTGSVLQDAEKIDSRLYSYVTSWLTDEAKLYQDIMS